MIMKIKITESQARRLNLNEQNKTKCQTPNTQFHIGIKDNKISCEIDLPINLELSIAEAKLLETNIHNAMELVLAPYFNR